MGNNEKSGWTDTVKESQIPDEKKVSSKKKKVSVVNIVILVALLALGLLFLIYFLGDDGKVGQCETKDQCGRYNVFYFKGDGYVCANNNEMNETSLKDRVLLFKYSSSYASKEKPTGCSCTENRCQMEN